MIKVFAVATDLTIKTDDYIDLDVEIYCADYSPATDRVILAGDENKATVNSFNDPNNRQQFSDFVGQILDAKLDPAGNKVCLVGDHKDVVVYDFINHKKLRYQSQDDCSFVSCSWSPSGDKIAVVNRKGVLSLLAFKEDNLGLDLVHTFKVSERDLKADYLHGFNAAFISDDKLIAAGKDLVQIIKKSGSSWEYSVTASVRHTGQIYYIAHLRDSFILTVGQDNRCKVWNLELDLCISDIALEGNVQRVRFDTNTDNLFLLDNLGTVIAIPKVISSKAIEIAKAKKSEPKVETPAVEESIVLDSYKVDEGQPARSKKTSVAADDNENSILMNLDKLNETSQQDPFKMQEEQINKEFKVEFDNNFNEESGDIGRSYKNKVMVFDEEDEHKQQQAVGIGELSVHQKDTQIFEPEKNKRFRKLLDDYFSFPPQKSFQPGASVAEYSNRKFLCYNMYGYVLLRKENKRLTIEATYSNKTFGRKIITPTTLVSMASLNNLGVLFASTGYIENQDDYENEELTDELKLAKISFVSSSDSKAWDLTLKSGENISAITLGYHWTAIATSKKLIRFISPNGEDTMAFGFNNPVVGMTNYENLLAVFYHDAYPFSGNQFLKVQIINISNMKQLIDIPVILSTKSELKWYGFSEEGILYVQDTKFMLWGLYNQNFWAPVYDGSESTNMWVIGVCEDKIVHLKVPHDEDDPSPLMNHIPHNTAFDPPLITKGCKKLFVASIRSEQEQMRSALWGHMRDEVYSKQNDIVNPMEFNRQTIKTPIELKKIVLEAEKERTEHVRQAALQKDEATAIYFARMIETEAVSDKMVKLVETTAKGELAHKVKTDISVMGNYVYKQKDRADAFTQPRVVYIQETQDRENHHYSQVNRSSAGTTGFAKSNKDATSFKDLYDSKTDALKQSNGAADNSEPSTGRASEQNQFFTKKVTPGVDVFKSLSDMTRTRK